MLFQSLSRLVVRGVAPIDRREGETGRAERGPFSSVGASIERECIPSMRGIDARFTAQSARLIHDPLYNRTV